LPAEEARISPFDRGFLYGDGFFETTRIENCIPFRLGAHINRLNDSCAETGWQWQADREGLVEAASELIAKNSVESGYLRLTVSRGIHSGSLTELQTHRPTVFMQVRPMKLAPLEEPPPFTLARASGRLNENSPTAGHKSVSYQANLMNLAKGRIEGADEVCLLNTRGHITEGTISNIFWVKNGTVRTPARDCGLLPGITREIVFQLCDDAGIPVECGHYPETVIETADEIFCTNSLRGIVRVAVLLSPVRRELPHSPVTRTLQSSYAFLVAKECKCDK
jgi:branched-chain amino acid aminotransferase